MTRLQWLGLGLGLAGVVLVLHDRSIVLAGTPLGWAASVVSLLGITLGTLYQKRFCGGIDWRTGNLVQYAGAGTLFWLASFAFETRVIHWTGELVFAIAWLVLVLSIAAVALMYWLIRRSAATGFASLFYLVPAVTALMAFALFGETLDHLSVLGMVICAVGVVLANRGAALKRALTLRLYHHPRLRHDAQSRPSLRATLVCSTIVDLPTCSGVHSPWPRRRGGSAREVGLALDRRRAVTGRQVRGGACPPRPPPRAMIAPPCMMSRRLSSPRASATRRSSSPPRGASS